MKVLCKLPVGVLRWSITHNLAKLSTMPVRNHQLPLSMMVFLLGSWKSVCSSKWHIILIQYSKIDQILHSSNQEASTSSRYDGVLDTLLIMLWSCKSVHSSRMIYNIDSWYKILYQRLPNPPKHQSGTISILQLWLCSWYTFNHTRDLKIGI